MYHFDICVALVFFSNSWINYILEQELPTDGTVIFSAPHTHSSATFTPFLTLERAWGALKVGRIIWDIPSPTLPSWPHWHGLAESSLFAWHLLSRSLTFHTVSMCLGSFSQPCLPHVCMPVLQKLLPHLGAVQMPGQAREEDPGVTVQMQQLPSPSEQQSHADLKNSFLSHWKQHEEVSDLDRGQSL